jgi:predicted AAA+ superfamily ATPase
MAEFNKIKYNNEYNKQSYDRINLMTAKGKKTQWTEKAKAAGLSLNAYITRAVDNYAGIENFTKVKERAKEEARREVLAKVADALKPDKSDFDEDIKKRLEGLI